MTSPKFLDEIKNDEKVFVVVEDDRDSYFGEPPTKLKNPKLFKPFEMYVQMYGLPAHNEMDPTVFVGLTYSFIFGAMFGDVGQGLLLAIGGGLLYWLKKIPLAGIIGCAGVFSTFFGFMFGSIFGFEDIIESDLASPDRQYDDASVYRKAEHGVYRGGRIWYGRDHFGDDPSYYKCGAQ